jgi:DNA-binding transcriptional LysR family regulator
MSFIEGNIGANMNLRHFERLIEVAREGSIGMAARRLNLSQPGLTKSIKELEELLRVKLFERGPKGVTPTIYGQVAIEHGRVILSEATHLLNIIEGMRTGGRGVIDIGVTSSIASRYLPSATVMLAKSHPDIRIRVLVDVSAAIIPRLRRGELDLAVAVGSPDGTDPEFSQEFLFEDYLSVVVRKGHELDQDIEIDTAALLELQWVFARAGTPLRQLQEQCFLAENLAPPLPTVETDSVPFTKSLLAGSDLASIMPSKEVDLKTPNYPICSVKPRFGMVSPPIYIVRRKRGTLTPAAHAFVDALKRSV